MKKDPLKLALLKKLLEEASDLELKDRMGIELNEDEVMLDSDVMELLKISPRTLYTWCEEEYIRFCKIKGRYYYLKSILLLDLLKIYND